MHRSVPHHTTRNARTNRKAAVDVRCPVAIGNGVLVGTRVGRLNVADGQCRWRDPHPPAALEGRRTVVPSYAAVRRITDDGRCGKDRISAKRYHQDGERC